MMNLQEKVSFLKNKLKKNVNFISNIIQNYQEQEKKIKNYEAQIREDQEEISILESKLQFQTQVVEHLKCHILFLKYDKTKMNKVISRKRPEVIISKKIEKKLSCKFCSRKFAKKNHLTNHLKKCEGKNQDVVVIDDLDFISSKNKL